MMTSHSCPNTAWLRLEGKLFLSLHLMTFFGMRNAHFWYQIGSACYMIEQANTLLMPNTAAALLSRFFEDYKKVGIQHFTAAPCCLKIAMEAVDANVC